MVRQRSEALHVFATTSGGEDLVLLRSRLTEPGSPAAIFCHGANGDASSVYFHPTAVALAYRGVAVLGCKAAGTETWGAADARSTIVNTNLPWLTAQGYDTSKIALLGGSMGSLLALGIASAQPGLIACVEVTLPVSDLEAARAADRGGFKASIEAKFGGAAGWQAARPNFNPIQFAPLLAASGMPVRMHASATDTIGLYAEAQALDAAIGNSCDLINFGDAGHSYLNFGVDRANAAADWILGILEAS